MILTKWTTAYKLTAQDGTTHEGRCRWVKGKANPHGVKRGAGGLCSAGFYHGYHIPELAGFLNPIHANIPNPRLWEVQIRGTVEEDRGILKIGATEMRLVRELPYVEPTTDQRIAFAISCGGVILSLRQQAIPAWDHWAAEWLAGRGTEAERCAAAAAAAARAAAYAAAAADAADAAYARDIIQDAVAFALTYDRPSGEP